MPGPSVIQAEIHATGHRTSVAWENPERVFTANVFAMPYGFVIRRVNAPPAMREFHRTKPKALEGGPRTFENDGGKALAEATANPPETHELVREIAHRFDVILTAACFIDDELGVYLVPHDHLKIVAGGEGVKRLRLRTMGDAMPTDREIYDGLTRLRDNLQRQVDELNRQLSYVDPRTTDRVTIRRFPRIEVSA